jgi:hypothetical protein
MTGDLPFKSITLIDTEYRAPDGELPEPHCLVAMDFPSGAVSRYWADDLAELSAAPFPVDGGALVVGYYASAEWSVFLQLGWALPVNILDLFAEFRCLTNGLPVPCGAGLLGALAYYGLDAMAGVEKDSMRDLAIRGGPFTDRERRDLLAYCEADVQALARLLPRMLPTIDLPRALLRGRYTAATARMEHNGVPIDVCTLEQLREHWQAVQSRLVDAIDADYGVFVPTGRAINPESRFGASILETANDFEVDPYHLADAVNDVWREASDSRADLRDALKVARQRTGLTAGRIARWENAGKDYSMWPGFDVVARELAGDLPALGLGPGFQDGTGYDDTDYAARLWAMLRDPVEPPPPKHDRAILNRAAARVGNAAWTGPKSFNAQRWGEWLAEHDIPWPRLESGALDLSDDAFRQMARSHPEVAPIRELRHTLSQLRLNSLAVGSDGRNRCMLSMFRARSGRNQPSNSRFIFGPSAWLRSLIQPEEGRAVAYVDWSQQEFGIAAALSGDKAMMDAYASGDPYLTFAKQAGAVPPDATKETHGRERDLFKTCALGVQYGMAAKSLSDRIGEPECVGRKLLELHRETYPRFWRWSQAAVDHAMLHGWLKAVFGWTIRVGADVNPRSLANFPMQANGAEMLRLACCLATERGIQVCAPVHDAVLVEGRVDLIGQVVADTQAAMAEASRVVLNGFELRSDAEIVRWPDRYVDKRGVRMWETITGILEELACAECELTF